MNVYVPASSAPPSRRWKQKLSIAVVFGSGLAIASLATSSFDQTDELSQKPQPLSPQVPLSPRDFDNLTLPPVINTPIAPLPVLTAKPPEPPALREVVAPPRTQVLYLATTPKAPPAVWPREPKHRSPLPSPVNMPIDSPQVSVEPGASAGPAQDLASNMAALGDGVYQVTSSAPVEQHAATASDGAAQPPDSGQSEVPPSGPLNALRADDHGTLQDQGGTCVPDQQVQAQEPVLAPDAAPESVVAQRSAERLPDGQQVPAAAATPPPDRHEAAGATASPKAPIGEAGALTNGASSPGDETGSGEASVAPATVAGSRADQAQNGSPSAPAAPPNPCKVSVQLDGRPAVQMPMFMVDDDEPAMRLSSLLALVSSDLPAADFRRLRESKSAEAILSFRDLLGAGFTVEVVDGALAIGVRG